MNYTLDNFQCYCNDISLIDIGNEGYIFSKKDTIYGLDKWESGESNILLITGLSRSGKSTLAEEMTNNNACVHNLELDMIENWNCFNGTGYTIDDIDPIMREFFTKSDLGKLVYANGMNGLSIEGPNLSKIMNDSIKWLLEYCEKECPNDKVIMEGVQIFYDLEIDVALRYPLIIKNTSMMKSFMRRSTRSFKTLRDYIKSEKDLNKFRKNMKDRP